LAGVKFIYLPENLNTTSHTYKNIIELQERVIDVAMFISLFFAVAIQTLTIFRSINYGFSGAWIIQTVSLISFTPVIIFRKRIRVEIKTLLIALLIFVVLATGLYSYGFLASGKIYIVLICMLVLFSLDLKKAVFSLLFLLAAYALIGFLYTKGILEYQFDVEAYLSNKNAWLLEGGIIALTSIGVLIPLHMYRNRLLESYHDIEKNQADLEHLVEKRTMELRARNEELNMTIDRLKETQTRLFKIEKMASLVILTAGVAHEINNPLNFISGGYGGLEDLYKTNGTINSEHTPFLLESIKTGLDRVSSIVSSLNQFSRNVESLDEQVDVTQIIENCLIMLQNKTKNRIKITKNYYYKCCLIRGNVGKIHQVFLNILSNSIQAIASDGSLTIDISENDNYLLIKISDSGIGISEDNLSKITDPFFTTKKPGEGTGLGLSITYSIIEEHKGFLEFESEYGKGTTVLVSLPVLVS
jgi:signal transduction histidine kinase